MLTRFFPLIVSAMALIDPSTLIFDSQLVERNESQRSIFTFDQYLPVVYFCEQDQCIADLRSYSAEFSGILTSNGKISRSSFVKARKDQLMFILLLNASSPIASQTVFHRERSWILKSKQLTLSPFVSANVEIQSSIVVQSSSKIDFERISSKFFSFFNRSIGRDRKEIFHFPSTNLPQSIGIYQLVEQFHIEPTGELIEFLRRQTLNVFCQRRTSKYFSGNDCGHLQVFPSFRIFTDQYRSQSSLFFVQTENNEQQYIIAFTSCFAVVGVLIGLVILYYSIVTMFHHLRQRENNFTVQQIIISNDS